jgi:hypothetical protein
MLQRKNMPTPGRTEDELGLDALGLYITSATAMGSMKLTAKYVHFHGEGN